MGDVVLERDFEDFHCRPPRHSHSFTATLRGRRCASVLSTVDPLHSLINCEEDLKKLDFLLFVFAKGNSAILSSGQESLSSNVFLS
jgi:hypothetical protein